MVPRSPHLVPSTTLFRSVERDGALPAGIGDRTHHVEGVVTIERRDLDRDDPVDLHEAAPERVGEPPPTDRGLEVERSEEHTSELQSLRHLVCRLLLEKTK